MQKQEAQGDRAWRLICESQGIDESSFEFAIRYLNRRTEEECLLPKGSVGSMS